MTEEILPVGEMEAAQKGPEGAGAEAPASGAGERPEARKAGEEPRERQGVQAGTETPVEGAGGEAPVVSAEAMRIAQETRRRLEEVGEKEKRLRLRELEGQIAAEKDPKKRFQLAAQYEAHVMLETDAYMTRFAREHGVEPGDPLTRAHGDSGDSRVNWAAQSQEAFEASVLRAANEDMRQRVEKAEAEARRVKDLEADLPNLVKSIIANDGVAGRQVDPGDGGMVGKVKDWRTATPEQVAAMRDALRRRG